MQSGVMPNYQFTEDKWGHKVLELAIPKNKVLNGMRVTNPYDQRLDAFKWVKDLILNQGEPDTEYTIVTTGEIPLSEGGVKYDSGKPRAGLMVEGFAHALMEVAKVSTFGSQKYGDNTWQKVEKKRYLDSTARHYLQYMSGETVDKESGLLALSHLAWNVLCLLEKELTEK